MQTLQKTNLLSGGPGAWTDLNHLIELITGNIYEQISLAVVRSLAVPVINLIKFTKCSEPK